ncbi:MAG: hypothetical protein JJU00_04485 [Opitutales bacterium]|nr:hypothetical protein [Opitutales bacterium]
MKTDTLPPPPATREIENNTSTCAASPIWVRPPKQSEGACPHTGLKHAAFYRHFVGNPRIRQARMGTGRERGTRLLWLPDVYAEILRRAETQRESEKRGEE